MNFKVISCNVCAPCNALDKASPTNNFVKIVLSLSDNLTDRFGLLKIGDILILVSLQGPLPLKKEVHDFAAPSDCLFVGLGLEYVVG